jgi:hypothetical protein
MPREDAPLSIEIPKPEADRPAWGRVGIVAAAGFVIGILWPRLTNTRIAPNPPADNVAASLASAAGSASSAAGPLASAPLAAAAPPPQGPAEQAVMVGQGVILHCRDGKDEKDDCGALEFDPVAVPKIKSLSQCPAAAGATGKLSIGFDVDFRRKAVKVLLGKSTTVSHDKAQALIKCADTAFDKVSLGAVPHEHRHYTVFYTASFAGQAKTGEPTNEKPSAEGPSAGTTTSESPASGTATVNWDVAIVRDAPKTGTIVGRVLRGSKVKVLAHQGEWFRVQYGSITGWVYRGTIGL